VLEQTFVDNGIIPSILSLLHTVIENCASLWLDAVGASKYLLSQSLLIQSKIGQSLFSLPSRFDSMISSSIFGSLKGLSP
jgi:hypothetical protein